MITFIQDLETNPSAIIRWKQSIQYVIKTYIYKSLKIKSK